MPSKLWILLLIVATFQYTFGQEDSLRSALNEINRRQKNLADYDDNEYGYALERPDDVAFLKPNGKGRFDLGTPLANFIDDDQEINKKLSSAFRERVEEDNQKQLDEVVQNLISNMDRKGRYSSENEDYEELLRELWDKYRRPYERSKMYASKAQKRLVHPRFGDNVGLKKRNGNEEFGEIYPPEDEDFTDDDEEDDDDSDDEDYPLNHMKKRYSLKSGRLHSSRADQAYPYSSLKRIPLKKRSSDFSFNDRIHEHTRSIVKKHTDPKVEKDLSNIFSGNKIEMTTTDIFASNAPFTTVDLKKADFERGPTASTEADKKLNSSYHNEEFSPSVGNQKPLQIKKKSVDWSDYFGLDRRKKSSIPNDLDKEWLIERYHKSVAMSMKKRSAGHNWSSFRKPEHADTHNTNKDEHNTYRIDDMDNKLRVLEDKIMDDALKYTGAHQGDKKFKEIQETKDRVISRIAAAYNIEKMRNALGEYKAMLSKNKKPEDEFGFLDEKRTTVPRKSALDKDRENGDGDNNIKCGEGDDDCYEQNYKTPADVVEGHFGRVEDCPVIERACSDVASILGEYGKLFKAACSMHQMCLLCSNNSWFTPTRQCNSLFISKAYDLCHGRFQCQSEAQRAIRYMLDVNRSLHTQPAAVNDCELVCPDIDSIYDSR